MSLPMSPASPRTKEAPKKGFDAYVRISIGNCFVDWNLRPIMVSPADHQLCPPPKANSFSWPAPPTWLCSHFHVLLGSLLPLQPCLRCSLCPRTRSLWAPLTQVTSLLCRTPASSAGFQHCVLSCRVSNDQAALGVWRLLACVFGSWAALRGEEDGFWLGVVPSEPRSGETTIRPSRVGQVGTGSFGQGVWRCGGRQLHGGRAGAGGDQDALEEVGRERREQREQMGPKVSCCPSK